MLSPHELATLMLVQSAPDQVEMTRTELDTLLESQLVSLESDIGERRRLTLTAAGARVLEVAARIGKGRYRNETRRADDNRV